MSRSDDFDRGLVNRRAVLGDAWVDRATAGATEFNADFQSLITRYAWHDIWGRPGLDRTTRRLLVLGMTMGLARWEEFELHCRAAVRGGVPVEQIRETLLQGAIYCGVPAANTAFKIAGEILKAEGLAPASAPLTPGARVATHHTFSAPQLKVALQGQGDGVPVVLSHALGLDLSMWDALAGELGAQRAVLRYDQRGHGGSALPGGPYTMDELVDDAARLIREWGRGPVAFVGLSMGGMVAQGLAIRYPELVRGIVVANSTSKYPPEAAPAWAQRIERVEAGGMPAIADLVIERYFSEAFRAGEAQTVARYRETVLRSDPAGYAACCRAIRDVDWTDRLSQVKAPALVIAGALDVGATPAMSRAIAERIAGSRLVVLDDVAHLSSAERPQALAALVREFVAALA
ncbi:MAG TPA: alpha/beta fold hydrolase [Burkholderiaceae bacterium]